jgi:hypothetical protein
MPLEIQVHALSETISSQERIVHTDNLEHEGAIAR